MDGRHLKLEGRDFVKAYLLAVAVLVVFAIGCAHKQSAGPSPVSSQRLVAENQGAGQVAQPLASTQDNELDAASEEPDLFDEEVDEEEVKVADPLLYWNKAMFHFNDKLYFWLLKPVATGYKTVLPETVRVGVRNFFYNLGFPIRFVGCILQANGRKAGAELGRFMFNTTVGVLGFGNPSKKHDHLNPAEEDLGQAFGRWGVGNGFYIVWPFLGPSTARDSVGLVGELFLDPVSYVEPTRDALAITAGKIVNNTSLKLGDYEAFKEAALDPYVSMRNAYIQNRDKRIED